MVDRNAVVGKCRIKGLPASGLGGWEGREGWETR